MEVLGLIRVLILDSAAHARALELLRWLLPLLLILLAIVLAWQLPIGELIPIVTGLASGG